MSVGYISYVDNKRHYGFIDSPELGFEQIYFHTTYCHKKYKHVYKGDKVNFDLSTENERGNEARNISFIQNTSLHNLKSDFENNKHLKGFLKKIGNVYYVKDQETYIFIRLIIANYEIDLNEVYENNLNKIINYKVILFTKQNKLRAINIDRHFLPECKLLIPGNKTEGLVFAAVNGGFQIKIYDNILGFLPKSLALKSKEILETGTLISVTCIEAGNDLSNVIFDLSENVEQEDNYKIEQENFVSHLKPGDKFSGKVKSTQGYGAFISFGLSEGLLHIKNILGEDYDIPQSSKREFSKILEIIFSKETEVDIEIEEINGNRISLTWDYSLAKNKDLYQEAYSKYVHLKHN